ncbi:MAG: hypothetical protein ACTSQY_00185 [Candidatus Odinarchaeia archaeon]|nr:MAG: hypothetical protein [Lokiarchaeota virus Fenrir Meg22_1012]URC17216.1 MAG: hypothetical protein [Lokiarchaeota virus Fenrir Meg22_1214]
MKIKDLMKKFGIPSFEFVDEKWNDLYDQFMEMSQLKSNFDIEKFTVKKQGSFIAHQFHFLMRQYSVALSTLNTLLIKKEELNRKIEETIELIEKGVKKTLVRTPSGKVEKYTDLYLKELVNFLKNTELSIVDKSMSIAKYEQLRLRLIELNGGEPPTNEQYQKEEPEYWKWFLEKAALHQYKQAKTGIQEGVWLNIDHLEETPLIEENFKVKMLDEYGLLDIEKINNKVEKLKDLKNNSNNLYLE